MHLRRLVTAGDDVDVSRGGPLPEAVHVLLEHAVLASRRGGIDPMDGAILAHGDRSLDGTDRLHPAWLLEQEYPLTPELLATSQAWVADGGRRRVASKGAPEAIAKLCRLDASATAALLQRVHALAEEGLRVLAVAEGSSSDGQLARDQRDYDFTLLGLVAFDDPLRPEVAAAVAQAGGAGIAVAMITGDHASTALAIARDAGIDTAAGALTGEQLERLDDATLADAVRKVRVYARVMPDQKLRLVQAFKKNGHVVAMTGDGVNDAPALKAAHVGIAMGVRGTDVAREAAGLVLLDENFERIVAGVRMGRTIFDNLRKVMTYIIAIHVPIAGLALLPVLMGLPPLMLPAHVVLTEMVIDPVCSLAFEQAPANPRIMQQPPRRASEGLIDWAMVWQGLLQGGVLLLATLAIYVVALRHGMQPPEARTLSIVGLTAGNLQLVLINASARGSWRTLLGIGFGAFWWVAGAASAALGLGIVWPAARELLHLGLPSWSALGLAIGWVSLAVALAAVVSRLIARSTERSAAAT